MRRTRNSARIKEALSFLGPAFIVSVAYIDPGNFGTNISGGSSFGYNLLWVILLSNIMAMFLQIMSAKLGIATNNNLPVMCKRVFSKRLNILFYIIAYISSIATTLAEFIGGALGFKLLFGIPLPLSSVLVAIITFIISCLQKYGQRIIEIIISILIAVICISYTIEMFLAKPNWSEIALHTFTPYLGGKDSLLIAVGMLGATVMPHVIYLHSQLVQSRNFSISKQDKLQHLKMEKVDIIIAMNIAFIVNAAMVIVSAAVFYKAGLKITSIEEAHGSLKPLLGSLSSGAFGIALLASGFSSSAASAMAGETVMSGFISLKYPIYIKRIFTMVPSVIIICLGLNPMKSLVLSQVFLSFSLPFAIIPMLIITNKKELMGDFKNNTITNVFGWVISLLIIGLNAVLLLLTIIS